MPLFRRKSPKSPPTTEHAVIAYIALSNDDVGESAEREAIFALEDRLIAAVERAGVGEFDGNEFGGGTVVFYSYGPDADALFSAMETDLRAFAARPAWCILRYGRAGDAAVVERRIDL